MFDGSIVSLALVHSDIRSIQADVLALKYAEGFHGADAAVAEALRTTGISIDEMRPALGRHVLINARGGLAAKQVLFVGVPPLAEFGYEQIRQFPTRVLEILADEAPATRDLGMTIHGANIGLDESECANEQLNGYQDALKNGHYPPGLRNIVIAERYDYRMGGSRRLL